LSVELPGDPYLGRLARGQLDARLPHVSAPQTTDQLVAQVRERIAACLDSDASLGRIARDLGVGARTLQRQLEALGTGASFHGLVEEQRRSHALRSIVETKHSVSQLAAQLGYADAASFRRAFRRWTGVSPAQYRQAERSGKLKRLTRDARPLTRKVSGNSG
jgi:AraC-like DNA-binding protein